MFTNEAAKYLGISRNGYINWFGTSVSVYRSDPYNNFSINIFHRDRFVKDEIS